MLNKFLITGGTGFLASELIARLYGGNSELTVVARNEGKLITLKQKYPKIKIITGDIADNYIAEKAIKGQDGVYHLAAFKHIGLAEVQARECVLNNVVGTLNVLAASKKYKTKFVLGISTDKAAQVSGVYGATKLLMERLFQDYERENPTTKYRVVRYGNILYSTGSVLCIWKDLIKKGKPVTVTDPFATRFYWTVSQAVDLIFECMEKAKDTKPYTPHMKGMRIKDLLEAMFKKYGEVDIEYIGLQPGENKHEKLTIDGLDSSQVPQYTVEEIIKMI